MRRNVSLVLLVSMLACPLLALADTLPGPPEAPAPVSSAPPAAAPSSAPAPAPAPAAVEWNLERVNQRRLNVNLLGMKLLGSWGALNLVVGLAAGLRGEGPARSFHLMNAGWGAVNLGLAAWGGCDAAHADAAGFTLAQALSEQRSIENIFLFNAGLDLAYVAGGAWMLERSQRGGERAALLDGGGKAVMLQGAVLFAFDLLMYLCQRAGEPHLTRWVEALH